MRKIITVTILGISACTYLNVAVAQTAKPAVAKRAPVAMNPKTKIDPSKVESRFAPGSAALMSLAAGDALTTSSSSALSSNVTAPAFALSSGVWLLGVDKNPGLSPAFAALDSPHLSAGEAPLTTSATSATADHGVTSKINADVYPNRGDSAALLEAPLLGASSSALAVSVIPVALELNRSVRSEGLKAGGQGVNVDLGKAGALGGTSSAQVVASLSKMVIVAPASLAAGAVPSSAALAGVGVPATSRQGFLTAVKVNKTQANVAFARPLFPTSENRSAAYHVK